MKFIPSVLIYLNSALIGIMAWRGIARGHFLIQCLQSTVTLLCVIVPYIRSGTQSGALKGYIPGLIQRINIDVNTQAILGIS